MPRPEYSWRTKSLHGCWYPGPLLQHDISKNWWWLCRVNVSLSYTRISTCVMLLSGSYRKCQYISVFPQNYSVRKWLKDESGAYFTNDFSIVNRNRGKFHSALNPSCSEVIAIRFCTWHDSCAVVACEKLCNDMIPINGFILESIFHRIWMTTKIQTNTTGFSYVEFP